MANFDDISFTKMTMSEGAAPGTPGTTGDWVFYFKTDGLYYKDDAGTETGPLSTGGGGGDVPEWISYLAARQTGETSHADDDFFDDDSLAGTAVTPTGTATWAESYGKMSVLVNGQGSFPPDVCGRVFALTPSSAPVTLETRVSLVAHGGSSNIPGAMIGFSDGTATSSNIACVYLYRGSAGVMQPYDFSGTFASPSASIWTNTMAWPQSIIVRAVWSASNTFEYSFSEDGVQFTALGQAADSVTLTPTHFFVGAGNSGSNPRPVSFDYVRINESDLSP